MTAISVPEGEKPSSLMIAAASVGNALEWFDLLVYGYFAVTISKLFFPSNDPTVSLLLALGTFGAAYLVRPLGALVLGAYADRAGRKASMMVSIGLMMLGTLLMAAMPTYRSVGVVAPIAVLIARLLQGFSVGGEFGSVTSFMVEHGPHRRGYFASYQWAGQGLAAVMASLFGVILTTQLTPDQVNGWGWRVPYIFGLLIGPVGLYIRGKITETPEFIAAERARAPVRELLATQWHRVLLAVGVSVVSNSSNYIILYMPTYAIKQLHLAASSGFIATLMGALILMFGAPVAGHWSDRIGRTRIMLIAAVLFLVTAYPSFLLLTSAGTLAVLVGVVCWLDLVKTSYSGVLPSLLADLFPTRTRGTGMALSYNISVPIFGGFAPLISAWLIARTGDARAPSYYLMATAALSVVALWAIARRLRIR